MQRQCHPNAGHFRLQQAQQVLSRRFCALPVGPARHSFKHIRAQAYDRDPFFEMTPFMSREMAIMDQQMEQMTRQMDAEMARMMGVAKRLEAEANQQAQEAVERAQRMEPSVQVQRSEERSMGSYRYYESISISMGPGVYAPVTTAAQPNPLLFVALLLAAVWSAVAAAFARNVHLTTYKDQSGWQLGFMWPFLLVISSNFRRQFLAAVRGQRAPVKDTDAQQ